MYFFVQALDMFTITYEVLVLRLDIIIIILYGKYTFTTRVFFILATVLRFCQKLSNSKMPSTENLTTLANFDE